MKNGFFISALSTAVGYSPDGVGLLASSRFDIADAHWGSSVARTGILSGYLNGANEFNRLEQRHQPAPRPMDQARIPSYQPSSALSNQGCARQRSVHHLQLLRLLI